MSTPPQAEAASRPAPAATPAPPKPDKPRIRFLDLLGGLPAVLAAGGLIGGLVWERRNDKLVAAYEKQAADSLKNNDLHSALVLLKRLVTLGDKPDYKFGLVMVYARSGDLARAEFLARILAPLDTNNPEAGFDPARYWLAQRLVHDSRRLRSRMDEGEKHLKILLKKHPDSLPLKATLADYYFLNARNREARPYLEAVAPNNPDYLIKLAGVCSILGDKDESRRRANQAIDLVRPAAEKDPKNVGAFVHWANALVVLQEFEKALEIIGRARNPENKALTATLDTTSAIICASWADALKDRRAKPSERIDALTRGLEFDSASTPLHTRLADMLQTEGEDYKRVRAVMDDMLEKGQSPALIHFALGNDAWSRGDGVRARQEWEKAISQKVPMPLAANNLAWSLAYLDPIDVNRALKLIEEAARQLPSNPQIEGTYGQVLCKLERWNDAVPHLENTVRAGLGSPNIHRSLAEAYDKLGKPVMANEQRQIANDLAAQVIPGTAAVTPTTSSPKTP